MSTKYVESETRMMSLVLIEGIAEVKRLQKAVKRRDVVGWSDVLRERIKTEDWVIDVPRRVVLAINNYL